MEIGKIIILTRYDVTNNVNLNAEVVWLTKDSIVKKNVTV